MLMPKANVSVAKTALMYPALNSSSTVSLNMGSIMAWCAAMLRSESLAPFVVAEDSQVLVWQLPRRSST